MKENVGSISDTLARMVAAGFDQSPMTKGGKNKDTKGKKQMIDSHQQSKRKRFLSTSQSDTMVSTRSRTAKSQQDNPSISKNRKRTRPEEVFEEEGEIS